MTGDRSISIWFFIGALLLIYGVLILIAGMTEPPSAQVVLSEYHAPLWWGVLLIVLGALYTIKFFPKR